MAGPGRRTIPPPHRTNSVKIKLDENLPSDLKTLLQSSGYEVTDVHEENLSGEADPQVLQAAKQEGRLLMTFDTDFADIRQYPPGTHSGIVVFRFRDQRWRAIEGPVRQFLTEVKLEDLTGSLVIFEETRVRYKRTR
jgi:predicted nuclease of predicted toxin-antitoxin system